MDFCYKTASVWLIVGKIFFIIKIVVPLLLIILGTIEVGKVVLSGDDKAISKTVSNLIKRLIAAVIIFFVPTLVKVLFAMVSEFSEEMKEDASNCINCLTDPYNSCDTSYQGDIFK